VVPTRGGKPHTAHVAVHVERLVVLPYRVRQSEGGALQAHRVTGNQVDALAETLDHRLPGDSAVEHADPAHVHVDGPALGGYGGDIGGGEGLGHGRSLSPSYAATVILPDWAWP
jgi:hypothetical protein